MLPILGLLTGWAMLIPVLVVIYLRLGGPLYSWMWPIVTFAASAPIVAFSTTVGVTLIFLSGRKLTHRDEPLAPPR